MVWSLLMKGPFLSLFRDCFFFFPPSFPPSHCLFPSLLTLMFALALLGWQKWPSQQEPSGSPACPDTSLAHTENKKHVIDIVFAVRKLFLETQQNLLFSLIRCIYSSWTSYAILDTLGIFPFASTKP